MMSEITRKRKIIETLEEIVQLESDLDCIANKSLKRVCRSMIALKSIRLSMLKEKGGETIEKNSFKR